MDDSDEIFRDLKAILKILEADKTFLEGVEKLRDRDVHSSKFDLFNEDNFGKYDIEVIDPDIIELKRNNQGPSEVIPDLDDLDSFKKWIKAKIDDIEKIIITRIKKV